MVPALIDGDIIAYRCAAANEKRTVEAVHWARLPESMTFLDHGYKVQRVVSEVEG
jgi:hypothetical protein